jgi:ParB family transcriptional regulator, chromosome partitioning protein
MVELEIAQLDRRYESLRTRSATRERRLLASIVASGQQSPIVVVRDGERDVVVDGYKRVRALHRLGHDLVRATTWDLGELEALVLERILRAGDHGNAIEEGWFLRELETRFGLTREELARRFDRTRSWVSRRLSLVRELPESVQAHVLAGAIGAHGAMRYLVPLARANEHDCTRIADAISKRAVSSRQLGELYAAYVDANESAREKLVEDPLLVLRAREEARREGDARRTPVEHVLEDLRIVTNVVRRAASRVRRGALDDANDKERERVSSQTAEARAELDILGGRIGKELGDAR